MVPMPLGPLIRGSLSGALPLRSRTAPCAARRSASSPRKAQQQRRPSSEGTDSAERRERAAALCPPRPAPLLAFLVTGRSGSSLMQPSISALASSCAPPGEGEYQYNTIL